MRIRATAGEKRKAKTEATSMAKANLKSTGNETLHFKGQSNANGRGALYIPEYFAS
jgi:hypothetical protein